MISPEDLAEALEVYCECCPSNGDCPQLCENCEKLDNYKKNLRISYIVVGEE